MFKFSLSNSLCNPGVNWVMFLWLGTNSTGKFSGCSAKVLGIKNLFEVAIWEKFWLFGFTGFEVFVIGLTLIWGIG